jgi:predicted DNA-binding protein (MmcQ/YjbR family)
VPSPLPRLRKLCLSLPETHEVEAWGEPTFRIKGGKIFAMYAADGNHHGSGRASVWIKATAENQALMIHAQPDRFFKPPYVGPSGWVGVFLDTSPDWNEVAELLRDGWKLIGGEKAVAKAEKAKPKFKSRSRSNSRT